MRTVASFPSYRPRRLRENPALRALIQETRLSPSQLIAPLFVTFGTKKKTPIPSMPGIFRLNLSEVVAESKKLADLGLGGVLLFGIPPRQDYQASGAYAENGVIQQAIKSIKRSVKNLTVMTDVCLCEYTAHGHCGIVQPSFRGPLASARGRLRPRNRKGEISRFARDDTVDNRDDTVDNRDDTVDNRDDTVDNDATLSVLARVALSHARAGADLVAPSAMMDGQVGTIRKALDQAGLSGVPIMSYSAKYASALYGPFREAVESAPKFGDRRGYQMDPTNREEALREVALDIQEGADIVMVKPASLYLDVLTAVKKRFHWPTAAYQVSGEYALIKAAASKGWVDEKSIVLETATCIRRAGADLIITYYAGELAGWLR